jgi:hypothetical protein
MTESSDFTATVRQPPPPTSVRQFLPGMGAILCQLVLVWGFTFFPTVDGPAHVHLAHALSEAWRGDDFYGQLVQASLEPRPNMATQLVLLSLMWVASPFIAEKIWLTLYFLAFAAAGAYVLHAINRSALCLLPWLVFCAFSFPLAFGFYNFAFSTAVMMAWFGYWFRHRDRFRWSTVLAHAAFAALAYFTHIFAFVISLFAIGVTALALTIIEALRRKDSGCAPDAWLSSAFRTNLAPLILASAPELLACLHFVAQRERRPVSGDSFTLSAGDTIRLEEFATASSFAPYGEFENFIAIIFAVALLFLFLYCASRSSFSASLPFAAYFCTFLLLYLVVPDQLIVRWMPARFQPLVFVALILWLAALLPEPGPWKWRAIAGAGALLVALSGAVRLEIFARLNSYYQEFREVAAAIPERSSLIVLRLHEFHRGKYFPAKVDVLIQVGSRIASERHSVDLKNFQAQSKDHPIRFRSGVSATAALGGDRALTSLPPRIDLLAYERITGKPIDYVMVYGYPIEVENRTGLRRLNEQIEGSYRLVATSRRTGLVRLYERHSAEVD